MLVVIATLAVDPSDADETRDVLNVLVDASRGDEGCVSYEFLESTEQPGRFRSVEEWEDRATLDAHLATDHVATAVAALTPLLTEELDVATHAVASA